MKRSSRTTILLCLFSLLYSHSADALESGNGHPELSGFLDPGHGEHAWVIDSDPKTKIVTIFLASSNARIEFRNSDSAAPAYKIPSLVDVRCGCAQIAEKACDFEKPFTCFVDRVPVRVERIEFESPIRFLEVLEDISAGWDGILLRGEAPAREGKTEIILGIRFDKKDVPRASDVKRGTQPPEITWFAHNPHHVVLTFRSSDEPAERIVGEVVLLDIIWHPGP